MDEPVVESIQVGGRSVRWWAVGCATFLVLALCMIVPLVLFTFLPAGRSSEGSGTQQVTVQVTSAVVGNRLVYVDDAGRIGSIDASGAERRLLTAGNGQSFLFPAWSPDGSHLAAIGSDDEGTGVYTLLDVPGTRVTELYYEQRNAPIYLYWAPDSQHVSFIASQQRDLALFVTPANGEAEGSQLAVGQPLYWTWTAGGAQVLVHSGGSDEDAQLAFLDVAQGSASANLARPGFFQSPAISAGGRYVAYGEQDEAGTRWLAVQDSESGKIERTPHRGAVAFGWSPTAAHLAFISPVLEERGRTQTGFFGPLRLLEAETGVVRPLETNTVLAFFWSPDGRYLAYFSPLDTSQEQNAWNSSLRQVGLQDDVLHLSLNLLDVNSGEKEELYTFVPGLLFLSQFLPFFDQYAHSHFLWTPDSEALAVPAINDEGDTEIFLVPVDGNRPTRLVSGEAAFWRPVKDTDS